jgi:hypothetical protein
VAVIRWRPRTGQHSAEQGAIGREAGGKDNAKRADRRNLATLQP